MSNKCLDDELFDIYMQDGETIIESLRKIYSKGFMDGVNDTAERYKDSAYKKKYDSELLDKVAEAIKNGCTCTDYSCGVPFNKDCANCSNNMIDYPSVMEIIEELKAEIEEVR